MKSILNTLGLMTRKEHERVVADNDNRAYDSWIKMINERDFYVDEYKALEAKFKQAVADLEKQAGEIAALKRDYARRGELLLDARSEREIAEAEAKALRPDALAMRRKRQMDRDRRKGR